MSRFRTTLNAANSAERDALLKVEAIARKTAVELECQERCASSPIGMADCSDIGVRATQLHWCRNNGDLLVRARVHVRPSKRLVVFRWRVPVPYRSPRSRVIQVNWGLTPAP